MRKISLLATAASLPLAMSLTISPVAAQSINYGQLEQLFGESVTAAAIGSPQKASDAPANMEIVNAEEIRRSGATNIPDALRYLAGIDVQSSGNGEQDVTVRGYSQSQNPRMLVLLNGRQVYIDDFGYTAWDAIPVQLDEIRQIEVVRGPNSALFGFNAAAGVINIVTFDPLNDKINSVTARAGTDAYGGGSAVGTFHWGDWLGIRASVGGYRANDAKPTGILAYSAATDDLNPYSRNGMIDVRAQLAPSVQATFEGTTSMSQHEFTNFTGSLYHSQYRNNSLKTGLSVDTGFGLLNTDVYRNTVHFELNNGSPITNVVTVAQASDLFKLGNDHTVRIGAEYRDNGVTGSLWSGSAGYRDYAGSAMWNWQIRPDLALTNSVRFDDLQLYRSDPVPAISPISLQQYDNGSTTQVSFNSGLVYKLDDTQTFRLLAARGIQAPSLLDYNLNLGIAIGPGRFLEYVGNPNVKPTAVSNLELDYDRGLPSLNSVLRTAVFYQTNRDLLQPSLTLPSHLYQFKPVFILEDQSQNIGSSNAVGGEISLKGDSGPWRWVASYSLEKIDQNVTYSYSAANPVAVGYSKSSPENILIGGLGYTIGKWELDSNLRWQSRSTTFAHNSAGTLVPLTIDGYLTSSLRAGYQVIEQVQAAVTVQQAQQATTVEAAGLPLDRRAIFSITSKF